MKRFLTVLALTALGLTLAACSSGGGGPNITGIWTDPTASLAECGIAEGIVSVSMNLSQDNIGNVSGTATISGNAGKAVLTLNDGVLLSNEFSADASYQNGEVFFDMTLTNGALNGTIYNYDSNCTGSQNKDVFSVNLTRQ